MAVAIVLAAKYYNYNDTFFERGGVANTEALVAASADEGHGNQEARESTSSANRGRGTSMGSNLGDSYSQYNDDMFRT